MSDDRDGLTEPVPGLTRRHFLGVAAAATGVAAAGIPLSACTHEQLLERGIIGTDVDLASPYPDVPGPPGVPPEPGTLAWFTEEEGAAMDALAATILPGTPEDPGAREAGVVTYLDHRLASTSGGVAERHYSLGPFPEKVPAGTPVPDPTPDAVFVPEDVLPRYGPQSEQNAQEQYRSGLAALDRYSVARFGGPFASLEEGARFDVVDALAEDAAPGFDRPGAQQFFNMVRGDIVEGMFADPVYGGNRGLAGWKLVGYPGAQRGYTPDDVQGRTPEPAPQGLMDLPHFHPGRPEGPNVVLPVSGSRRGHESDDHQGR